MRLPQLVQGHFVRRDNRFRATVKVNGREAWAHVANSGRLTELFTPGRLVWLAPAKGERRKTAYDLKLVEYASVLVSVDAQLPNPLFAEALAAGRVDGFRYETVQREVFLGHSRLDFRLSGPGSVCWVETKSVTLVEDGVARFPDAPTERGRKHLQTLIDASDDGAGAAVVFIIQRPDAALFRPHVKADPEFAVTLSKAARTGVEIKAFSCRVSLEEIVVDKEIPVSLA